MARWARGRHRAGTWRTAGWMERLLASGGCGVEEPTSPVVIDGGSPAAASAAATEMHAEVDAANDAQKAG